MFAFRNGVTVLDEEMMNSLRSLQSFALIYEGLQRDANTGSGVTEFDNASFDYALRFTATGTAEMARAELHLVSHGMGADMAVELRSGFNADGSTEGVMLKRLLLPKEFIPATRMYWSIPLDATGLTAETQYWLIIRGAGDMTNHFHNHGETVPNVSYPVFRRARGGSGGWAADNSIHFRVFSGESGNLLHGIYGNGVTWLEYSGTVVNKVYYYLPDALSGPGVRTIQTLSMSNGVLVRGTV